MTAKTLAERQAWMRQRMREREAPAKPEALDPIDFHHRKRIAAELNELLLSGDDLDIQFLLAIIELRNVARECRVDEPRLILAGRGPGLRHVRYSRKVADAKLEMVAALWRPRRY